MKKNFRAFFVILISIGIACSSAETLTDTSTTNSAYPSWYSSFEFTDDGAAFYSRATAVASDSALAKKRAETEARGLLESYIAKEMEDIRSELERDGIKEVSTSDFVLKLRNAHAKVESNANLVEAVAKDEDGFYRAFARVTISKKKVSELIESELKSTEFTTSQSYIDFLASSN